MHILCLDESGTHAEARHFVLAGFSAFERETYYLEQSLDELQREFFPDYEGIVPFHVSELRANERANHPAVKALPPSRRRDLIERVYGVIAASRVRLFAVAIEKEFTEEPLYERGFEEIVSRFDRMLQRLYRNHDDPQRGMVMIAESSYRENVETVARQLWTEGHRWGQLRNMAMVPLFTPAANTRLLQAADFVANAVYGRYEHGLASWFDRIAVRLDQEDGRLHGLAHLTLEPWNCFCPACVAHRAWKARAESRSADWGDSEGEF